jgi:hypothetical protein
MWVASGVNDDSEETGNDSVDKSNGNVDRGDEE